MIVYAKTQVDDLSEFIIRMVSYKDARKSQHPSDVNAFISTTCPHRLRNLEFYTQVFIFTF